MAIEQSGLGSWCVEFVMGYVSARPRVDKQTKAEGLRGRAGVVNRHVEPDRTYLSRVTSPRMVLCKLQR